MRRNIARRTAGSRFLLAATLVLSGTLAPASPAVADSRACPLVGPHCYQNIWLGPLGLQPHGFSGEYTDIRPYCVNISNPFLDITTAETWSINTTDNAWIESGVTSGYPRATSAPFFFWADGRADGSYYEHHDYGDPVVYGTTYRQSITRVDSTSFIAKIGPYTTGPVTAGWPANYKFTEVKTGSETSNNNPTNPVATLYAQSFDLHYYDENNVLHYPWTYNTNVVQTAKIPSDWGFINPLGANAAYEYGTVTTGC